MIRRHGASVLAPVLALLPTCCVTIGKLLPTLGLSVIICKWEGCSGPVTFTDIWSPRVTLKYLQGSSGRRKEAEGMALRPHPTLSIIQNCVMRKPTIPTQIQSEPPCPCPMQQPWLCPPLHRARLCLLVDNFGS